MKKKIAIKAKTIVLCILVLLGISISAILFYKCSRGNEQSLSYEQIYSKLNKNILDINPQNIPTDFMDEIYLFSEKVKGEFVSETIEKSIFLADLVIMLEKALYDSCNYSPREELKKGIEYSKYIQVIKSLNSNKFELSLDKLYSLFPQLTKHKDEFIDKYDAFKFLSESDNCINMFCINIGKNEYNYIFVYESGGSDGANNVVLTRFINDKFETICEFSTQNNGYGKVIQYEKNFYYVFLEYNYMLKNYDGIRIHKLGINSKMDNILIKYLPYKYIWRNYYYSDVSYKSSLDYYVDSIKDVITSDEYIERGSSSGASLYYGDEDLDADFLLTDEFNQYYRIDFANVGIPIYITKSVFTPSDYRSTQHLRVKFYINNKHDCMARQLENLELGKHLPTGIELEQMWFKKIENKILTFRIYHISDYNYLLNIVWINGDKVTQIRTDIFSPQRKFKVVENSLYEN